MSRPPPCNLVIFRWKPIYHPQRGKHPTVEDAANLLAGRIITSTDSEDTHEPVNHRQAFDYVSEYRPCAALSVRGPVGMALRQLSPRSEGSTKWKALTRRIEWDSERSEVDSHLLVVKREAIIESLGYESGWMIRRNQLVKSRRQWPGLLSVHLLKGHPPSYQSQVSPTCYDPRVCRTHETDAISRRP